MVGKNGFDSQNRTSQINIPELNIVKTQTTPIYNHNNLDNELQPNFIT